MTQTGSGNLYEAVLAARATAAPEAGPAPPRASAAVVLWRRAASGVEVYWVQRSEALAFMGGWHAFPGGGLARTDAALPVAAPPVADTATTDDVPPGILACAIRELFEETGILLSRATAAAGDGPIAAPPGETLTLATARQQLLDGAAFSTVLGSLGQTADAHRLVYAGRWLTPPFAPLRFDNRFFLLEWPPSETMQPEVIPGELATGAWIDAAKAWSTWRSGQVLAAPPILHILRVLADDGPQRGLARLVDSSEADLGPVRRVELRPGVLMFPLATRTLPPAMTTNAYLLGNGDAVLVDPGAADAAENRSLLEALQAARDRLHRRVTAIWLTHHHPDHVSGVNALRQALAVPVLAHPATAERLAAQGIAIDGELLDGQEVILGASEASGGEPMTVQVIYTPGHARGHLCFLELGQRSMLVGDMVAGFGTIVIDPPEGDMDDYLASLARLIACRPHTLFPGHGPAVKNAHAKLREYIDHRLWREGRVLAAWQAGLHDPAAMLASVYDDVPAQAHALAARQILAHLTRLQRNGQIGETTA